MERRDFDRIADRINAALADRHAGSAHPVPARVIIEWIEGMTGARAYPRDVSEIIRALRDRGEHIGHGSKGYFAIKDPAEYPPVIEDIEHRLADMRRLVTILRRNYREYRRRQIRLPFGADPRPASQGAAHGATP